MNPHLLCLSTRKKTIVKSLCVLIEGAKVFQSKHRDVLIICNFEEHFFQKKIKVKSSYSYCKFDPNLKICVLIKMGEIELYSVKIEMIILTLTKITFFPKSKFR